MRRIAGISIEFVNQLVFWSTLLVLCVLTASVPAMASNKSSCESANRIALSTYCSEAHRESALLANGSTSYIHVINRASERAMEEYPDICPDVSAWKARIGTILDQYGDEDLHELCRENPEGIVGFLSKLSMYKAGTDMSNGFAR